MAELIAWQRTSGVPVTARSGALLRRAVPRENWELNNDDVQLLDKIGRVSCNIRIQGSETVLTYLFHDVHAYYKT